MDGITKRLQEDSMCDFCRATMKQTDELVTISLPTKGETLLIHARCLGALVEGSTVNFRHNGKAWVMSKGEFKFEVEGIGPKTSVSGLVDAKGAQEAIDNFTKKATGYPADHYKGYAWVATAVKINRLKCPVSGNPTGPNCTSGKSCNDCPYNSDKVLADERGLFLIRRD